MSRPAADRHPTVTVPAAPLRRCVICTLTPAEHKRRYLLAQGYSDHPFDPGERRRGERRQTQREAAA